MIDHRTTNRRAGRAGDKPVAVDVMSGERGTGELVAGAVAASRERGVDVIAVGRSDDVEPLLARQPRDSRVELAGVPTTDPCDSTDGSRGRTAMSEACRLVGVGRACAAVSAGSTAHAVAAAALRLGLGAHVLRPAIAVLLPGRPSPTVLLDAGANAEATPDMLAQFAIMGSSYASAVLGVDTPRVGLLTIGAEDNRGSAVTRAAHALLRRTPVRFTGNVEGTELLNGAVDVAVTDGFSGNVALKSLEAGIRFTFDGVRDAVSRGPVARVAGLAHRSRLRAVSHAIHPDTYGGAAVLGLAAPVVVSHSSARAGAVANCCALARDLSRGDVCTQVVHGLAAGIPGRPLTGSARGTGDADAS